MSAKVAFLRDLAAVLEKHGAMLTHVYNELCALLPTADVPFRDSNVNAAKLRDRAKYIEREEKGGGE